VAKLMTAKCSRCGKGFRADSKGDLLNRIRTHMWKEHEDWMRRRVKSGLRKAKKAKEAGSNPAWLNAIMAGVFPPANIPSIKREYGAMSPDQRTAMKQAITALTLPLGGEASAIAAAVMRGLDYMVR